MRCVLTCASVWESKDIVDKYPVIEKYNPVVDYPYPNKCVSRLVIEVDDLIKFCYDIDNDIIIGKAYMEDEGMLQLTIYDDYIE